MKVIGFVCDWAVSTDALLDAQGRLLAHPGVHVVRIPCSGFMRPDWLEADLRAGGDGSAQPGGTVPPPPGTTLTVEESEFRIVPQDLAAGSGRLTFQLKNVGTVEHNFVVEGTAVKLEAIQPGEAQTAAG